jgi:hypothetical protein
LEREYLYDIVHFTPQGSRRAAELIGRALQEQGCLGRGQEGRARPSTP